MAGGHLTALSVLISSILALFKVEIPRKRNSYELGINMKNAVASMFLALMFALTASCGGSSSDSEGTATPEIVLNLPAEFSTGETGRAVPDYVTGIFLTVTGDGMEDIEISIDPENLSASVTVTFGTRTFSIVITTSIGKTFTGWKTVEVTAGSSGTIVIDLVVNDPPKVTLKASTTAPAAGQAVALTATATDADGDPMTFSWTKSGGALSASALSGKWHSPDSGNYKVTFTASDGRGGVGSASVALSVQPNLSPVLTATPGPADFNIGLSWTPATGAVSYKVFYRLTPGVTTASPFVTAGTLSLPFTCASASQVHYFMVYGVDGAGALIGNPSNEAFTICPPLNPPTNFQAWSIPGANRFDMTWGPAAGALDYELVYNLTLPPPVDGPACWGAPIPLPAFGGATIVPGSPVIGTAHSMACTPIWSNCYAFALRASYGSIKSALLYAPMTTFTTPSPTIAPCLTPLSGSEWRDAFGGNDTLASTEWLGWVFIPSASGALTGVVHKVNDIDYYRFDSGTANSITFNATWATGLNTIDMRIVDAADATVVASNLTTPDAEGPLTFAPTPNTIYYLVVTDQLATTTLPAYTVAVTSN